MGIWLLDKRREVNVRKLLPTCCDPHLWRAARRRERHATALLAIRLAGCGAVVREGFLLASALEHGGTATCCVMLSS